nr:probable transmembrane GTPase FZO-like, chloroplastic isoform X1 [Ipomoea batatas]
MVSLLSQCCSVHSPSHCLFASPTPSHYSPPHFKPRLRCANISVRAARTNVSLVFNNEEQQPKQQPRTLFPGGFKRPEIKVPNLVLQLSTQEVFDNRNVLDEIDQAVSGRVGIVLLSGGGVSGGKLYEAACLLKSVIRERAYLLIDERVDIAAAVNASGVLLSDQGLPTIVARNTMLDTKSESVVLPLVARIVQTPEAALQASNSEGADFIIFNVGDSRSEEVVSSVFETLKVPVFVMIDSLGEGKLFNEASYFLELGASGLVISTNELKFISNDDDFSKLFFGARALEMKTDEKDGGQVFDSVNGFPGKKGAAGFTKLLEREKQLIETEKLILRETINAIEQAAPLMEEVSLLIDAVSQLDEPFLLVIVGEFNSGKSTFINALLGERYLKDGVIPSTNEITFLRYSELDSNKPQRCERNPDDQYVCYLSAPILKDMIIVDTPGTNVMLQRQQRLTEEFVPRADLLIFVMSADRPLTESEVNFLRYTQQWKKKVVFVLNKSDIYLNMDELEEAVAFIKENTKKLLSTKCVTLFPVSSRCALEAKLSSPSDTGKRKWKIENTQARLLKQKNNVRKEYIINMLLSFLDTYKHKNRSKLGKEITMTSILLINCCGIVLPPELYSRLIIEWCNCLYSRIYLLALGLFSNFPARRQQTMAYLEDIRNKGITGMFTNFEPSTIDTMQIEIESGGTESQYMGQSFRHECQLGAGFVAAVTIIGSWLPHHLSNNASIALFYPCCSSTLWDADITSPNRDHLWAFLLRNENHIRNIENIALFTSSITKELFFNLVRVFFFLRAEAYLWKNLVFASAPCNQCCFARCLQKASS